MIGMFVKYVLFDVYFFLSSWENRFIYIIERDMKEEMHFKIWMCKEDLNMFVIM
jgi:hypothetical protein